jgi:flagellar biogenesis protein FliO
MAGLGVFSFFANAQCSDGSFVSSMCVIFLFLSVLCFCGYGIVQFCKRGGFVKNHPVDGDKTIKILDGKFLYGRKCVTLIECCGRLLLVLVTRDDAVKLSEWEIGKNEVDR